MNTCYEEEVTGSVIGSYMLMGVLMYEGRKQGKTFYAETIEEIKIVSGSYIDERKAELGDLFSNEIYCNKDGWALRIYA